MSRTPDDLEALSPLKRALLALTEMQARLDGESRTRREPIAIIGVGCRFPGGVASPQSYWRMLRDGVDGVSEVPPSRWDIDAYYDPDPSAPGKMSTRWGGFLEQVDQFDADFFGISPREALWMDPQQRLLLEVAWEALEDAGQTANHWSERPAGVFIGVSSSDYVWHQLSASGQLDAYTSTGNAYSIIANRLSYLLDLKGPSLVVDTACSSSLVAIHLACQSLRNQECHLALAGGVNLVLSPLGTISFSKFGMMAADGRCKSFDASADGFVRGEGCGLVVLKRLSDALAGDDPILALIRGSAVNQDGRSNGLTAPNMYSQEAVIRQALAQADVFPADVQYVEAHGTGTPLGDPIETEALTAVLGPAQDGRECVLGSVKGNIGHLEAAAGIAGLIKVVLALQHETIPPQLHFRTLNPHINLAHSSLVIGAAGRPWPKGSRPRVAGISSFGFGGTNAHTVLEEAPERPSAQAVVVSADRAYLLPISARSPSALAALARAYGDFLPGDAALSDVAFTASVKRNHHAHRVAVVGRSSAEWVERLRTFEPREAARTVPLGPVFVFGGLGGQWAGMGRELLEQEPVFRAAVEECDALLRPDAGWSVLGELLDEDDARSRPAETGRALPVLFALQIGLARLWRSWGIEPAAVVSQGEGEIAAAYVAGTLSLTDAVKEVWHRGRPAVRADADGGHAERFTDAVMALAAQGHEVFLELGPHPALGQAVTECLGGLGRRAVALASLRRHRADLEVMLTSLGRLYEMGHTVAWSQLYKKAGQCVRLPAYPWQHKRFWPALTGGRTAARTPVARRHAHPMLGEYLQAANSGTHCWQTDLGRDAFPYLNDHRVQGAMVLPAAAYVEMVLAASAEALGDGPHALEEVVFKKALFLPEHASQTVQLDIAAEDSGGAQFQLLSRQGSKWELHATGAIRRGALQLTGGSVEEVRARCLESVNASEYYQALRQQGMEYGPSFQGLQQIWRCDGEAIGQLRLPDTETPADSAYQVHPALLDAGFQLLAAALPRSRAPVESRGIYLPVRLESVKTHVRPRRGAELWGHVIARSESERASDAIEGDLFLMDADGQIVIEALGLHVEPVGPARPAERDDWHDWLHQIQWRPKTRPHNAQAPHQGGRWLILADKGGIGRAAGALLEARGETVVIIASGELGPLRREEFGHLLHETFGDAPPRGVIHLWSLDFAPDEPISVGSLEAAQELGCRSALHLVQALGHTAWREMPRLWLVTRCVQDLGDASPINVSQSPLSGLGRVIALEHPELRCSQLDLGPDASPAEIASLVGELVADDDEGHVGLRGEERYVARLARWSPEFLSGTPPLIPAAGRPFRVECDKPGILDHVCLRETSHRAPGPGDVQLRVSAAALNFNDVLKALGLYPDLPPGPVALGSECVGTIVALGPGVEEFAVGEEVVAFAEGSFGTLVTTSAQMVAAKPPRLTMEEAATLPVVFMTAVYALEHLGRVARGDRVLIHAAAGGVGLAALQVAQRAGAEILATAGSPAKRAFLESLGVRDVMDSRSCAFADEVMARTGGRGVDIVLNSLAGEAMVRSLAVMAPYGRFLELGKRDLYENRRVGLWPFRKGVSYLPVDLAGLVRERPAQFSAVWREVMLDMVAGVWQPLPHQIYPIHQAADAFRSMAQGKHIGKIVLSMRDLSTVSIAPAAEEAIAFSAEGTYLVTGGLGALGLQVAEWMVKRGARHLVLLGRRDASEKARGVLSLLQDAGAHVVVAQADVSSASQVTDVLAAIDRDLPALRGVIHAAGVLDDGLLLQQDWERCVRVMAPKVAGAWNLHDLTRNRELDFFVLFSSMAGVTGSIGQGSYAAANAFLDGLAAYRRRHGLSGLSIDWGPWAGEGMAASHAGINRPTKLAGSRTIRPESGLQLLERLLLRQGVSQIGVIPADWSALPPGVEVPSILKDLVREAVPQDSTTPGNEGSQLRQTLAAAAPEARQAILESYLLDQIARVLGASAPDVDVLRPLASLGIDSLMAVELRTRIQTDLSVIVPIAQVLEGPSAREMSVLLLEQLAAKWLVDAPRSRDADSEWEVLTI